MSKNRVLAEQIVDRLRPRLVDLVAEVLDQERGADDEPARVPGISPEGYARAAAHVARWQDGRSRGKARKAG